MIHSIGKTLKPFIAGECDGNTETQGHGATERSQRHWNIIDNRYCGTNYYCQCLPGYRLENERFCVQNLVPQPYYHKTLFYIYLFH